MRIFLSWSGELSRELAEALRDWLPAVLQTVKPFFTPNDIEKGARWNKDIAQELETSAFGIFCMTKENLTKPWIMFEAGALSKSVDSSRVCPVLFGVDNADLEGPLVQFQAAPFSEVEMRKLIKTINGSLGDQKLEDSVLTTVFDMWWPALNDKIGRILERHNSKVMDPQSTRTERDLLEEILQLSRISTSSNAKASRTIDRLDPGAIRYSLRHMVQLEKMLNVVPSNERVALIQTLTQIFSPIKYIVEQSFRSHEQDAEMSELIDTLDRVLFLSNAPN